MILENIILMDGACDWGNGSNDQISIFESFQTVEMETSSPRVEQETVIDEQTKLRAYELMCMARLMTETYEENKEICSKYVHSTSRGHEAIQLAAGLQLQPYDYASLYYRDESMLLGMGLQPYELMLQLMAKRDDPFSGGRSYYGHPALKRKGFPTIPHQSSATGMQAIPATGMAQGIAYLESQKLLKGKEKPIVLCSMGDGSVTEGEVAEAFQMAVLKKLPILYLIQDNDWGISATGKEMRTMDAYEYAGGFKGMERMRVDGADFTESYRGLQKAIRRFLVQRIGVVDNNDSAVPASRLQSQLREKVPQ